MTPMERRQLITVGVVACAIVAGLLAAIPRAATTLPARLTDHEFWQLSTDASEPDGYFRSDNLTSNETGFLRVVPELVARTKPGRCISASGPSRTSRYIAATRPAIAIIFDIRRGNLLLQLMYKAIFELTRDRADFVSMLFSRPRPERSDGRFAGHRLFAAFGVDRRRRGALRAQPQGHRRTAAEVPRPAAVTARARRHSPASIACSSTAARRSASRRPTRI